jgi:hypothetical protein
MVHGLPLPISVDELTKEKVPVVVAPANPFKYDVIDVGDIVVETS